jgi:hypothetical protein
VILVCLVLLVATTDIREWKSWFGGQTVAIYNSEMRIWARSGPQVDTQAMITTMARALPCPPIPPNTSLRQRTRSSRHPHAVLMYHPCNNTFTGYTVGPQNSTDPRMTKNANACLRCRNVLPILIDALLTSRPRRFQPDQSPFPVALLHSRTSVRKKSLHVR